MRPDIIASVFVKFPADTNEGIIRQINKNNIRMG
jgi:hypothetical protein